MPKKCPPGVLCIENITIIYILLLIIMGIITYFKYIQPKIKVNNLYKLIPNTNIFNSIPNIDNNVLENKHLPPLKHNVYMRNSGVGIPINIKTRGYDDTYKQVGIITRINGKETILPLMGRALHTNRNKWQYYTMTDQNNSIKLPVSKNGKSCTGEYGCNECLNGDSIYVEGYNDAFKATIYENNQPRYIPYL